MSPKTLVRLSVLVPVLGVFAAAAPKRPAATKVRLTLATLHAAALTAPRAATDSTDGPYFLVSIQGPHTKTATMHLPDTGHLRIHENEALGARPLVDLALEPGDSVRLLVTVVEGAKVQASNEWAAAAASTKAMTEPTKAWAGMIGTALAPVTKEGAHWLGSATLLLTNENGTVYWRALECVATCDVLSGDKPTAIGTEKSGARGVVELSGAGGTYHMQLQGQQVQ